MITQDMQRQGIATKLVERVCEDATAEGYDFVEAYVNKNFTETAYEYRGPLAMYLKCGFTVWASHEDKSVVRKALK